MKYLLLLIICLAGCSSSQDPKIYFDNGQYREAYSLWLPKAEQGDAEAMNYLGILNYLGLGKQRDYRKAAEWFQQSAQMGFADAQYNLGSMYENGESVIDNEKAKAENM